MRRLRAGWTERRTLAAALAAVALAVLVAGAVPADRRAAINGAALQGPVAALVPGATACQGEWVPPGPERVRVPAEVAAGSVRARTLFEPEAGGEASAGAWSQARDGELVLALPATAEGPGELCVESQGPGTAQLLGSPTGAEQRIELSEGEAIGLMRLEFLHGSGAQPFWGPALAALPERIAAANGSGWAPWLVGLGVVAALAGLVALVGGASRAAVGWPLRREALAVAALALGSGGVWAGLTPMFQSTDELAHAAYVQAFAELGHPPTEKRDTGVVSQEMGCWATVTRLEAIRFQRSERPPWTRGDGDPCAGTDREMDAAQYQAVQPPAYYALAMSGYRVAGALGRPLPDRLLLARLVSVLLAAVTAVSVFLLVREAIPGTPWAARGAAVAAGLQPVLMFNHSVINSDALVMAVAAAIAAVLGRTWRRGPSLRRALALGALLAVGALAKINFLIVVPLAVAVQLVVWLRWSSVPLRRRGALLAACWLVALVPPLAYATLDAAIWEGSVQEETSVAPPTHIPRGEMASYVWQAFLPPLPFMQDQFPGAVPPMARIVLGGTTTRLGYWNDYGIATPWSYLLAGLAVAIVAAGVVAALRRRWWLALAVAAAVSAGFAVMLVAALYVPGGLQVQGRYLLVLSPVWGLAAGAAVCALRPRWQGHAVAILAAVMLGWSALAVGATLGRWYL